VRFTGRFKGLISSSVLLPFFFPSIHKRLFFPRDRVHGMLTFTFCVVSAVVQHHGPPRDP